MLIEELVVVGTVLVAALITVTVIIVNKGNTLDRSFDEAFKNKEFK